MTPDFNPEAWLIGTPYLIPADQLGRDRFTEALWTSWSAKDEIAEVRRQVQARAAALLQPLNDRLRAQQVAESNTIEGYEWTEAGVSEVVRNHQTILAMPVRDFISAMQGDPRSFEALGLYRATEIAETWVQSNFRPREYDIRALHSLIVGDTTGSGKYKTADNRISGSLHSPTAAVDTAHAMHEFATWWQDGTHDAVLTAVVAHAWLTHIHPFDDGNGRMARLLANICLLQRGYPPLILRADSERGEYYDALAASDDGDILPLYELVTRVLGRTVGLMKHPGYVDEVVHNTLLADVSHRYELWLAALDGFLKAIASKLPADWTVDPQGKPDPVSFDLLAKRDAHGNSWCAKLMHGPSARWLVWFGFNHELLGTKAKLPESRYPSLFFSPRDRSFASSRPYQPRFLPSDELFETSMPLEVVVYPDGPVLLRDESGVHTLSIQVVAERIACAAVAE